MESKTSTTLVYLKVLNVYLWIFTIFGLNLPPPCYAAKSNPPKKHLVFSSYVVSCAFLAAYEHNIAVHGVTTRYQLDSITQIMSYIQNSALVLVHSAMEINTVFNHKDLKKIFELIELLECEISLQSHQKSVRLKRKLLKVSALYIVLLTVFMIYLHHFVIAGALSTKAKVIIVYLMVGMQMKGIEYAVYIQIISELIEVLWESLKNLKCDIENFPRPRGHSLPCSMVKQLLRKQHFLNRVWFVVHRIERYFAGPMFLLFYYNAMGILFTVNWAYVRNLYDLKDVNQSFRILYIFVLLMNLLVLCGLTEKCMEKYQSIASLLHNFKLHSQDSDVMMRLREFAMQLMHQKLRFTCSDYLDIDFRSYGKMLLVISAYAIILVQFKMEDSSLGAVLATQQIFGKKS